MSRQNGMLPDIEKKCESSTPSFCDSALLAWSWNHKIHNFGCCCPSYKLVLPRRMLKPLIVEATKK